MCCFLFLSLPAIIFFFFPSFFTFAVRLSTSSLTFINSSLRSRPRTQMKFKRFKLTNHSRCLLSFVPRSCLLSVSAAVSHPNFIHSLGYEWYIFHPYRSNSLPPPPHPLIRLPTDPPPLPSHLTTPRHSLDLTLLKTNAKADMRYMPHVPAKARLQKAYRAE